MIEAPPKQSLQCSRCEIDLGTGRGQCPRAKDTDMCIDCAVLLDPPMVARTR